MLNIFKKNKANKEIIRNMSEEERKELFEDEIFVYINKQNILEELTKEEVEQTIDNIMKLYAICVDHWFTIKHKKDKGSKINDNDKEIYKRVYGTLCRAYNMMFDLYEFKSYISDYDSILTKLASLKILMEGTEQMFFT